MNRTTNAVLILWGNLKRRGKFLCRCTWISDNKRLLLTVQHFLPLFSEPLVMKTPQVSVITLQIDGGCLRWESSLRNCASIWYLHSVHFYSAWKLGLLEHRRRKLKPKHGPTNSIQPLQLRSSLTVFRFQLNLGKLKKKKSFRGVEAKTVIFILQVEVVKIENSRLVGRAGRELTALNFLIDRRHFCTGIVGRVGVCVLSTLS